MQIMDLKEKLKISICVFMSVVCLLLLLLIKFGIIIQINASISIIFFFYAVISFELLLWNIKKISLLNTTTRVCLFGFLAIFYSLYMFRNASKLQGDNLAFIVGGLGLFLFYLEVFLVIGRFIRDLKVSCVRLKNRMLQVAAEYWQLILLCFAFLLGSLETWNVWTINDASIYHEGIQVANEEWKFYNIAALNLGAHGGYAYCIFLLIGDFITPHATQGIVLVNILMAVLTIVLFYKIIEYLFPTATKTEYTLTTVVFAFSPLLFGMVCDMNLEFPQLCFFTWLIYAFLYDKTIFSAIFGALFAFTKETAVLVYFFFCFGRLGKQLLTQKVSWIERIKKTLIGFKLEILTGILWLFLYFLNLNEAWAVQWTGDTVNQKGVATINSFGIWGEYIIEKLIQMFVFNYNWILWLILMIILLFNVNKIKNIHLGKLSAPLCFSVLAFWGFQYFYITWTNYRYISLWCFFQAVAVAAIFLGIENRKKIKTTLLVITDVFIVMSNFTSYDWVCNGHYLQRNFGNGCLNVINLFSLDCIDNMQITRKLDKELDKYTDTRDCIAYNRQYLYGPALIQEIFQDIEYEADKLMIIPNLYHDFNTTFNNIFYRDAYVYELEMLYWNKDGNFFNANTYRDGKENFENNPAYEKVNIVLLDSLKRLDELQNSYNDIYIIFPKYSSDFDFNEFTKGSDIDYIDSYQKNVFKMELYKLRK